MFGILAERVNGREAGDGLVVTSGAEVIFVQSVGGDELLSAELVGLSCGGGWSGEVFVHGFVGCGGIDLATDWLPMVARTDAEHPTYIMRLHRFGLPCSDLIEISSFLFYK